MSEHTRRSPYEPEHNDGSERNSRKEPEATPEPEAVEETSGEGSDETAED